MKKYACFVLVSICLVLAFSSSVLAERPIRILALDPLSGPLKVYGDRFMMGWKLAADEINEKGGLLGRKVEIITEDDQFNPEVTIRKAQKYVMEGGIDFVTKSFGSQVIKPLMDLTTENKIVLIVLAMSDDFAEKQFSYNSVQLVYRPKMMTRLLVTYLAGKKSAKRFYLINPDYVYGHDMATSFKQELLRQISNAEIVGNDFHPMDTKDMSSILTKVKATKAEFILTGSFGPGLSILMKQRQQFGVPAIVVSNPLADPMNMRELAEASLGSIVSDCWMSTVATKESDAFRALWNKKYRDTGWPEADNVGGRTYIAAKFLFSGIRKANSLEVNKLIPILEQLKETTINGEAYLEACTHTLQSPLPVGEVVSKSPPYYSVPTMIPAGKMAIEKDAINNPRCK